MTEEELKQEAKESFEQYKVTDEDYVVSPYSDDMGEKMLMFNYEYEAEETYLRLYTQGYLAGAESREKRIAELEKQHDIVRNERNLFQERCEDILENYYCDHKCKCAELEAEVKEWKDKAELWCKTANLKDHNIMINKELEKENAELKAKIYGGGYEAVITKKDADIILLEHLLKEQKELHKSVCDQLTHTHRNLGNQLTKAKVALRNVIDYLGQFCSDYPDCVIEAEKILKEE